MVVTSTISEEGRTLQLHHLVDSSEYMELFRDMGNYSKSLQLRGRGFYLVVDLLIPVACCFNTLQINKGIDKHSCLLFICHLFHRSSFPYIYHKWLI